MRIEDVIVEVADKSLAMQGQIVDAELNIEAIIAHNDTGQWTLKLPVESAAIPALSKPGSRLIITTDTGQYLSGPRKIDETEQGSDDPAGTVTFTGTTDNVLLKQRLAYPQPANPNVATQTDADWKMTGTVEAVMHALVSANLGPSAPASRRDERLVMGTNLGRGPVISVVARFEPLHDVLAKVAAANAFTFGIAQRGDVLVFETAPMVDRSDVIRLSVANDSLTSSKVALSAPGVTHVIVGGEGAANLRSFSEMTTPESLQGESLWGERIERYVDAGTGTPEEIKQPALDVLKSESNTGISTQSVPAEDSTMGFGVDYFVGDQVAVEVDGQEPVSVVSGAILKADAEGVRLQITLGDPHGFDPLRRAVSTALAVVGKVNRIALKEIPFRQIDVLELHKTTTDAALTQYGDDLVVANAAIAVAQENSQLARDEAAQGIITASNDATAKADTAETNAITQALIDAQNEVAGIYPITETDIANGAISTPKLAANSITVEKMVIASFDNLANDPTFKTPLGTYWESKAGVVISPTAARDGGPALVITSAIGSTLSSNNLPVYAVTKVEPGASYRVSASVYTNVAVGVGVLQIGLGWKDTAGATGIVVPASNAVATVASTWTTISGIWTAPANVVSISSYSRVFNPAVAVVTRFDFVSITRAANASLIVDGTITAKIVAGDRIRVGNPAAEHIDFYSAGLIGYAPDGITPKTTIATSTGKITAVGGDFVDMLVRGTSTVQGILSMDGTGLMRSGPNAGGTSGDRKGWGLSRSTFAFWDAAGVAKTTINGVTGAITAADVHLTGTLTADKVITDDALVSPTRPGSTYGWSTNFVVTPSYVTKLVKTITVPAGFTIAHTQVNARIFATNDTAGVDHLYSKARIGAAGGNGVPVRAAAGESALSPCGLATVQEGLVPGATFNISIDAATTFGNWGPSTGNTVELWASILWYR